MTLASTPDRAVTDGIVIVGNGVSGYACARKLAGAGEAVMMIGPGLPHDRPPLSKRALATGRLPLLATADVLAQQGIVHLDGLVTGVDLSARRLTVTPAGGGEPVVVHAPRLVWATGLRYPRPPVPGLEECDENATGVGLMALVERLRQPGRRVIVIGAGLIGTETAATLAATHRVTLLDMVARPLARFLPIVSDAAAAALAALEVDFVGDCRIEAAAHDANGWVVHTHEHGDLRGDVVVSAAGFRSSLPPELAGATPPPLALPADETLRVVGHDDLWACGDCVSFPHPRWGRLAIPHWDHALWSGRHVAGAIAGSREPYMRDPYFFSDIGPLRIQQVGLADAAVEWNAEDDLIVGRDDHGSPACVLLMDAPARLGEARKLVAAAA
jgi:3-phenylpropionate/trans-cinnamate dioxygenase ferredoxin reductase component